MCRFYLKCAVLVLPFALLVIGFGCNQETAPPLHVVPDAKTTEKTDEYKPPTAEETAKAMALLDRAIKAHGTWIVE